VRLNPAEAEARRRLLAAAAAAGLAGVELEALAAEGGGDASLLQRVARVLLEERMLARVGESQLVERVALETLQQQVRERWQKGTRIEVGEFKELVGLSRKHAIPLLEYLDRERVTRRVGAARVVV
jgi:selenocysteine-specific elongation factor